MSQSVSAVHGGAALCAQHRQSAADVTERFAQSSASQAHEGPGGLCLSHCLPDLAAQLSLVALHDQHLATRRYRLQHRGRCQGLRLPSHLFALPLRCISQELLG